MNPDVIAILELGSALEKTLVGDMNLTPWSALLTDLLGAAGIHDASRGYELTPTWYRWPLVCGGGLVLDNGFFSEGLVCSKRTVQGNSGSDHRPVIFEFSAAMQWSATEDEVPGHGALRQGDIDESPV